MTSADTGACRGCGCRSETTKFKVREMMYGTREEFDYFECPSCRSVQIITIPADLERHYPEDYYSLVPRYPPSPGAIRRYLKRQRAQYALGRGNRIGSWLADRYGVPDFFQWFRPAAVGLDDPILDVGSGTGELVLRLHETGFTNLTGIDPFIRADVHCANGVRILKRNLEQLEGPFLFIMMHHTFEHMPDPGAALGEIHRLLPAERFALVRTPVAGCHAFRKYGADWSQLDAPRHLFIPSEEGMRRLAEATGFELADVIYDSSAYQFWTSEQYRRDIPMTDPRSFCVDPSRSIFSGQEMAAFQAEAERLNAVRDGDQAAFYLRKRPCCPRSRRLEGPPKPGAPRKPLNGDAFGA